MNDGVAVGPIVDDGVVALGSIAFRGVATMCCRVFGVVAVCCAGWVGGRGESFCCGG